MIIKIVNFEKLSKHYKLYQEGLININLKKDEFLTKLEPLKNSMQDIMNISQRGETVTDAMKQEYEVLQDEAVQIDGDFRHEIKKMNDELSREVYLELKELIGEWSSSNDVDMVIDDSNVVISKVGVDITDDILEIIKSKDLFIK